MPTLSYADFDGSPSSSALTQAKAAWLLALRRQLHRIRRQCHRIRGLIRSTLRPIAANITAAVEVIGLGRPLSAGLNLLRRAWRATSPPRTPWVLLWAATTTPGERLVGACLGWAGRVLRSVVLTGSDAAQWALCHCGDRGKALARKLGFGVEWLDTVGREAARQQARRIRAVLHRLQPLHLIRQVAGLAIARRVLTRSGRAGWCLLGTLVVAALATWAAQHMAARAVTAVAVMTNRTDEAMEPAAQPPAPAPAGKPATSRPKPHSSACTATLPPPTTHLARSSSHPTS